MAIFQQRTLDGYSCSRLTKSTKITRCTDAVQTFERTAQTCRTVSSKICMHIGNSMNTCLHLRLPFRSFMYAAVLYKNILCRSFGCHLCHMAGLQECADPVELRHLLRALYMCSCLLHQLFMIQLAQITIHCGVSSKFAELNLDEQFSKIISSATIILEVPQAHQQGPCLGRLVSQDRALGHLMHTMKAQCPTGCCALGKLSMGLHTHTLYTLHSLLVSLPRVTDIRLCCSSLLQGVLRGRFA